MIWKTVKYGVVATAGALLIGGLAFGSDVVSYVSTASGAMRDAVKDTVPVEFELRRARDMVEQIIPEMHANIRLIAEEEVEIAALQESIEESRDRLDGEADRIAALRSMLNSSQASFVLNGQQYERSEVRDELARRLEHVKEAKVILDSKQHVLKSRRNALEAARETLQKTRAQKALLEDRIAALASKHRMIQAASVGSEIEIDDSKLTETQQLLEDIRKRLEVSERVLAHQSRFTESIPVETVDEQELMAEADAFLAETDGEQPVEEPTDAVSQAAPLR